MWSFTFTVVNLHIFYLTFSLGPRIPWVNSLRYCRLMEKRGYSEIQFQSRYEVSSSHLSNGKLITRHGDTSVTTLWIFGFFFCEMSKRRVHFRSSLSHDCQLHRSNILTEKSGLLTRVLLYQFDVRTVVVVSRYYVFLYEEMEILDLRFVMYVFSVVSRVWIVDSYSHLGVIMFHVICLAWIELIENVYDTLTCCRGFFAALKKALRYINI